MTDNDETSSSLVEDTILYDLSYQVEWPVEKEVAGGSQDEAQTDGIYTNAKRIQSSISRWTWSTVRAVGFPVRTGAPCLLPHDLIKLINSQQSWLFARSPDGNFLAVLQDGCLEILSTKEDYGVLVGRCTFTKDSYPQWRKVAWSQYSTTVAYSDSDGTVHVCDLKGILLFSFQGHRIDDKETFDYSAAICSLIFISQEIHRHKEESLHLLVVSYSGAASCLEINSSHIGGYRIVYQFDFASSYSKGVSGAIYEKEHSIIIVGGCAGYDLNDKSISPATKYGLTAWRLLSDEPFLKPINLLLMSESNIRRPGIFRRISTIPVDIGKKLRGQAIDGVYIMALSPCSKFLATVHISGCLSIWEMPSLRRKQSWHKEELPFYGESDPNSVNTARKLKDYPLLYNAIDCKWWNDSAVILAQCSGSLTVVRVSGPSLCNLFGEQCEWLEPAPRVSFCKDEDFLALECEQQVKSLKHKRTDSNEEANKEEDNEYDPFLDDSDGEDAVGVTGRLRNYSKSAMYNLTEMEYFQPPRKRPKLVTKSYRLVSVTKTTPEKLFIKKLEDEEYGEALALAQRYDLDGDRVFQRQWRKSPVSVASIQDYLSKVTKRSWVLHECCERVPEELDAARELLRFALTVTDIDEIAGSMKNPPVLDDVSDPDSDFEEYEGFDVEEQRLQEIEQREKFVKKFSKLVDFKNLSLNQKEMIRARIKILKYMDRLSTYEHLLGGYDAARERYNREKFTIFRQQDMLGSALEYARSCDWKAVDTLFTFHGDELREHRLPILFNFPKTLAPSEYKSLLPIINEDGSVDQWPEIKHRDPEDWSELENYQHLITPFTQPIDPTSEFYREYPHLVMFKTSDPEANTVKEWYIQQARQIDMDARDIEGALDILRIGAENYVEGLEDLTRDFKILETLVYECEYDPGLTLVKLENTSRLDQLRMLMEKSSKEMYIKKFHRWAIPFLKSCNDVESSSGIFHKYVTEMSEEDLTYPCLLCTSFISSKTMPPVIANLEMLVNLALEAVYLNCQAQQLDLVKQLHSSLSKLDKIILKNMAGDTASKIKQLDSHIYTCTMLSKHGVKVTPTDIREVENDRQRVQKLLVRLSRTVGAREQPLDKSEWECLLKDMLLLRERSFSKTCGLEAAVCLEIFVESLLTSGNIKNFHIAGERMMRTAEEEHEASRRRLYQAPQKLSYESSVALVIKSSQEYFDASTPSSNDNMLSLARECLLLITDRPPQIREKLDLIEAVVLLNRFGVDRLPLQVRLTEDRLSLVKRAVDGESEVYRKTEPLLRLGMLLRVCGSNKDERKGKILTMIVDKALNCHDLQSAHCLCQELISLRYTPSWEVCLRLASQTEYKDAITSREILGFTACYCDASKLVEVMNQMRIIDSIILQNAIEEHEVRQSAGDDSRSHKEIGDDSSMVPESFEALSTKHSNPLNKLVSSTTDYLSPSKMLETTAQGTKAVLSATGTVLSATSSKTRAVLSNVGNTDWWKNTIDQTLSIIPLPEIRDQTPEILPEVELTNDDLEKQGCLEFYSGAIDNSISKLGLIISKWNYFVPTSVSLNQAKFRLIQLNQGKQNLNESETAILDNLVREVLPYDFSLGIAYLLAYSKPKDAYSCLRNFPTSALTIEVALYCFSLMLLSEDISFNDSKSLLYDVPPMVLIKHALAEVHQCNTKDVPDFLVQLKEQLYDFSQGEKLQQLGRGIDLGRFTTDNEYKEETILGLAMTSDEEQYKLAVSLAHRSGTDLWLVLVTHLEYLFTECQEQLDCVALHDRIKHLNMIPELVSRPLEFFNRMDKYIYPFISGRDHNRLILYFSLLSECETDSHLFISGQNLCKIVPADHIKMLKKIKSVTPTLDYTAVITDSPSASTTSNRIFEVLSPILDVNNVPMFAKMMPNIPYTGFIVSASSLYLQVAKSIMWKDVSENFQQHDEFNWVSRYESCNSLLRMCYPNDLLQFFREMLFTSEFSKFIHQKNRQNLIKKGIKLCKIQGTKERKNQLDEGVLQNGQSFHTILLTLLQMSKHLDSYSTTFISDMVKNSKTDERMASYLKMYDESQSQHEQILDLASIMLCNGCSPVFLQGFLAVVPGKRWLPLDVLQKCMNDIIRDFSGKDDNHTDIFDRLVHVVKTISDHEKENGKVIVSKDVIDLLKPFCGDASVDVNTRVGVLQLLDEQFQLEESESRLLLLHRTKAIVCDGWSMDVCDNVFPDEDAIIVITNEVKRFQLFQKLADNTVDIHKLKHLITLLNIWPTFAKAEAQDKSWHTVMTNLSSCGLEGGKEIIEVVRTKREQLSLNTLKSVFSELLKGDLSFFAIKLSLLAYGPEMKEPLLDAIRSVDCMGPSQCDEELVKLMLEHSIAVYTVGTLYYAKILEYLLSGACTDAEAHVHSLARQLQDHEHLPEAGTLLLNFRGTHPGLRTFGNALSSLTRWLRS